MIPDWTAGQLDMVDSWTAGQLDTGHGGQTEDYSDRMPGDGWTRQRFWEQLGIFGTLDSSERIIRDDVFVTQSCRYWRYALERRIKIYG